MRNARALLLSSWFFPLALVSGWGGVPLARAADWQGTEVVEDGVTHIRNPADPMEAAVTLKPDELWRLGGESEDEAEIFGRVDGALVDEAGQCYFLDTQLNEIRVYTPDGKFVRSLGREGEGPGEFRNAVTQFFLPGNRIGVMQMMPSRIVVLGRDGEAMDDLHLPLAGDQAMTLFQEVESRGDEIILSYTAPSVSESGAIITRGLVAMDGQGKLTATVKEDTEKQPPGPIRISNERNDEDYFRNWEIGADGRIYVAPFYQKYQVYALDPAGGPTRVIEREYESVKRTAEELKDIQNQQEQMRKRFGVDVSSGEPNPYQRDIARLVTRDNGDLWVLSSEGRRECPEGKLGVFDVFDPEGRYLRRVTVDADYDERYDEFTIAGDRLFVFKEANSSSAQLSSGGGGRMMIIRQGGAGQDEDREAQPLTIVCYSLPES